ncbi:DUF2520 domain-containing protein [Candidatus Amoebophilus asiaticus]|nr:DUF2520 domain-containing protein [Candidatus Amoebophilus asiaticus]
MKIVLIGAGSVATNLGIALKGAGSEITQVYSRTEKSAKELAERLSTPYTADINEIKTEKDLYVISIKDSAIFSFIKKFNVRNSLVVHTSGTLPISIIENVAGKYGVLYPVQTFTKDRILNFKDIPICIEGNNKEVNRKLKEIANSISDKVFEINSESRKVLHIAAVFACNFTNHMYAIAENLLQNQNIPFEILHSLINETANKSILSDPANMQTGPAKRNDVNVIVDHLKILENEPGVKEIYESLSKSIQEMYREENTE